MDASLQDGGSPSFPTHAMVEKMQSQWLFTASDLLKSPSILEGMPAAQELSNRQKGVNFITQVGIMLKLPQLTLATASVFLHRFYMRHPMQVSKDKGVHHYQIAATALFLATKVEENCRKMRELIVACCRVAQKQPNLVVDDQSKEYWKWRDTILHNEDVLLEALCFDLQLEQPYRTLFDFLCYYQVQDNKNLRNTSWAFLNDSHVTTLCLLYPPRTIAGSALYAGAKLANVKLPNDDQGRAWWEHLELDIFDVQKACNLMAETYENPLLPRKGQKDAYPKEEDIMSFEQTRRTQSPSVDQSPARSVRSTSQGVKRDREEAWGEPRNGQASDKGPSQTSGAAGTLPSPKRIRTESRTSDTGPEHHRSRIPVTIDEKANATHNVSSLDDVQQRIDEIVSASTLSQGPQRRPSRRPSLPKSSRPGHLERQHSSELASRQRPVSSHNHYGSSERIPTRNGDSRPTEGNYKADDYERPRTEKRERHDGDRPISRNGVPDSDLAPSYSRTNDVFDDAEKVDYGSEEGEV